MSARPPATHYLQVMRERRRERLEAIASYALAIGIGAALGLMLAWGLSKS